MKATGLKHLLRSIRKSGVSFLAVAVIAGVSIAIFQGFQSSAHAILRRADQYFVENRLETLEISCANGITQEDIDAIAGWEGVRSVEGGYTDSALLYLGGERVLVQTRSLLETMNTPVIIAASRLETPSRWKTTAACWRRSSPSRPSSICLSTYAPGWRTRAAPPTLALARTSTSSHSTSVPSTRTITATATPPPT